MALDSQLTAFLRPLLRTVPTLKAQLAMFGSF